MEVGDIEVADSAKETVAQARAALDAGRFEDAASLYGALAEGGGGAPARTAQAVALYEAGDLRAARKAAETAVQLDPKDPAALNILGVVLVDAGSVEAGMVRLGEARQRARAAGRKATEARALVNLALARVDLGLASAALDDLAAADALAGEAGDPALGTLVASARLAAQALAGTGTGVGPLLGKGQLGTARKAGDAALAAAKTRRQRIAATLELAAVDRAEGKLDAAARKLADATTQARENGLVREQIAALADLGLVQGLGGRSGPAADTLRAAARLAKDTGYRVLEVDSRCELGIQLVHGGDLGAAEAEQRAAGMLLAGMQYPQGVARQAELGGLLAGQRGDLATARAALSQAAAWYAERGRNIDAARAATALAAAWQQVDPATAGAAASQALAYFSTAGDALGPAHVSLARALADARAKRLEPALVGFAKAAEEAEAVGGGRGAALARTARDDAAAADYDIGLVAYNAGDFAAAQASFGAARTRFEALGEAEYAVRARRSAAWAAYNALVSAGAAVPAAKWQALVEETAKVEDAELYARAYGAAVMSAHAARQRDLGPRIGECIRVATKAGVEDVAARCHGAAAERDGDLAERAEHAREAWRLDPGGSAAVYALYSVAVDAYNAGDNGLAVELARLARPRSGQLAGALDEILAAAGG